MDGNLASIIELDDSRFALVLGTTITAYYPSYTVHLNILQTKIDTWFTINVHFTSEPPMPTSVLANADKPQCYEALKFKPSTYEFPDPSLEVYTIEAAKGSRLQYFDLHDFGAT